LTQLNISIRQEKALDHIEVFDVITRAFAGLEQSSHEEQYIVERLRKSPAYIPELSLVATEGLKVVGHILISKIKIKHGAFEHDVLSLAPISVLPAFQSQGVGSKLIVAAHDIAKELGHKAVVLVGHALYYPRFGYKKASDFGIQFPFDSPDENCMAIELTENALVDISGVVVYPKEFFG